MPSHLFIGRIFNVSTEFLTGNDLVKGQSAWDDYTDDILVVLRSVHPWCIQDFCPNWIDSVDMSYCIFSLMLSLLLFSQCNAISIRLLYMVLIQCFQNEELYSSFQGVFNWFIFLFLLTFILCLFSFLCDLLKLIWTKKEIQTQNILLLLILFFSTPWKPNKSVSPHINVIYFHLTPH